MTDSEHKGRWQRAYDQQPPPESLDGGLRQFNGYRNARLYAMLQASLQRATAHWRGWRILDAGCGSGDTHRFLTAHNQIVGVDFSRQMARYAARHYAAVSVGDVEQLPFRTGQFDAVIATGVWQCLPTASPFLSELQRVVRPGGEVVLGWMLNREYLLYRRGVHFRLDPQVQLTLYSRPEIEQQLAANGWRVIQMQGALFPLGLVGVAGLLRPFLAAYTVWAIDGRGA
jgi:SAM-dependent methyltransferase